MVRPAASPFVSIDALSVLSDLLRQALMRVAIHGAVDKTPILPRQTSATMRSKPARCTPPAAERPRSSSMTSIADAENVRRTRKLAEVCEPTSRERTALDRFRARRSEKLGVRIKASKNGRWSGN